MRTMTGTAYSGERPEYVVLVPSAREEGAEHVLQDAAVAVVVGLARGVDPDDRVDLLLRAVGRRGIDVHRARDLAVVERGDAGDVERLLADQAERLGVLALRVLQREHAHPDQVRAVDALERLGDQGNRTPPTRPLGDTV